MMEFLSMGGYSAYIWSAYGIAALVLTVMLVASLRQLRAAEKQIAMLEAASPRRQAASTEDKDRT
jgi:heme exporter protein D